MKGTIGQVVVDSSYCKQLALILLRCVRLSFMATDHILALLLIERDKLTGAIEALQGTMTTVERDSKPPETIDPTAPVKRKLSAAGRRAIVAGTKKRWAAIRAAKSAAAPAPVAATSKPALAKASGPVKKRGLTEAGRKALSIAMKKRWAKKKAAAKGK